MLRSSEYRSCHWAGRTGYDWEEQWGKELAWRIYSGDPSGVFPQLCRNANPIVGRVEKIEVNPAAVLKVFWVSHRKGKSIK